MDPDTAQVVPKELCEALFAASGAKLVEGRASGLEMDGDACTGVRVDDTTVPCDAVVCAMGAWSVLLEDWIGAETGLSVPLEGVYSSSIVFEGSPEVAAEPCALFCAEDSNSCHLEVYPRVDGSVYLCGIGGSDHVRGARLREGAAINKSLSALKGVIVALSKKARHVPLRAPLRISGRCPGDRCDRRGGDGGRVRSPRPQQGPTL